MSEPTTGLRLPSSWTSYLPSSSYTAADVLAKLKTQAYSARGILETASQLDYGKVLHLSADGLPEYPDSTAGTSYLETAFTTASGFSALDTSTAALTVSGGELILAVGAAPTTYVAATKALDVSSKTVRVKWRCAQTDLTTMEIGTSGAGTHVTKSIAGLTSGVTDITTGASFTDFEIRFNSTGNHGANPVYIDFVYVGDGTYSTKLPDVSGNGNDATVYGATPVDGIAGKLLQGDGVNDRADIITALPLYFTMESWIQRTKAGAVQHAFAAQGTAALARCSVRYDASNNLTLQTLNVGDAGVTNTTVVADNGALKHIVITYNGSAVLVYLDGALTTTISGAISATTLPLIRLFNEVGAGLSSPFGGTVTPPRIYNRALSAAEVWELYQKPKQAGGPVNGTQVGNLLGYTPHIDGESPSLGTTFAAKIMSGEYTYPASCTSAPTTNAGNVIVNSGATYDTFLAYDGTTNVAYRGYRAHGTGAPTWTVVFSSGVTMPAGANLAFASGNGISFAATADAAGMTSELLADYEEGAWTPGVSFGGGTTGITYTTQEGRYTKIGNRVIFSGYIVTSSKGSSTGSALITGLPYTCFNSTGARGVVGLSIAGVSFADYPSGFVSANSTAISLFEATNAGSETALADTDFSNSSVLRISGAYATS